MSTNNFIFDFAREDDLSDVIPACCSCQCHIAKIGSLPSKYCLKCYMSSHAIFDFYFE